MHPYQRNEFLEEQNRASAERGFWEGREFRLELSIAGPVVIKFESPVDFILRSQTLASNDGLATFKAWGASQGTPGGTFATPVNVLPNNGMSDAPVYARQTTINTGGTFTPTGGQVPRETIDILASTATAQIATVGSSSIKARGLPAGTYYLAFTGTNAKYKLIFEERP